MLSDVNDQNMHAEENATIHTKQSDLHRSERTPGYTRWCCGPTNFDGLMVGTRQFSQSGLERAGRSRTLEQVKQCRSLMSFNDLMVKARRYSQSSPEHAKCCRSSMSYNVLMARVGRHSPSSGAYRSESTTRVSKTTSQPNELQ